MSTIITLDQNIQLEKTRFRNISELAKFLIKIDKSFFEYEEFDDNENHVLKERNKKIRDSEDDINILLKNI